jgi:hypothetical protein
MAKVTGPLMSMSASGTIGGTITFDKRGFVRERVIPANPQTAPQGNVRQMLLAVQKCLKVLHLTAISAVSALAPTSYRWNSFLLAATIGPSSADFEASITAFNALTGGQKTSWDDRAITGGLTTREIAYADDPAITAGGALFAVSRALFGLGINAADLTPGAANFTGWGDYVFLGT